MKEKVIHGLFFLLVALVVLGITYGVGAYRAHVYRDLTGQEITPWEAVILFSR